MLPLLPAPRPHRASAAQLRAVYTVMRILAEDDRARGADHEAYCDACRRGRAAAGSVDYAGTRLCNGCATDYEVLRMDDRVPDVGAYLGRG